MPSSISVAHYMAIIINNNKANTVNGSLLPDLLHTNSPDRVTMEM